VSEYFALSCMWLNGIEDYQFILAAMAEDTPADSARLTTVRVAPAAAYRSHLFARFRRRLDGNSGEEREEVQASFTCHREFTTGVSPGA
jgi:hypothetical protein